MEDFTADWILGSTSYYAGAPAPPSPVSPTGTRISHTDMLHVNHNGSTANAVRDDSHSAGARAEAGTQGHQPTAAAAAASAAVSVAVATASAQAGAEMPEGMGCSGGAVAAGQGSSELLAAMAVLEQERDALAARLLDTGMYVAKRDGASVCARVCVCAHVQYMRSRVCVRVCAYICVSIHVRAMLQGRQEEGLLEYQLRDALDLETRLKHCWVAIRDAELMRARTQARERTRRHTQAHTRANTNSMRAH